MVLKSDNAAGDRSAFLGLRLRHRLDVSAEVLPLHEIFSIVSSGSPLALIASSLRSTSKKPLCFITRPSSLRQRGRCQVRQKFELIFIGKDCKKSASQMLRGRGNDANSKPECVRPSAVTLAVGPTHAVCRRGRSKRARRAAPSVILRFAIEITVVAGRCHFGRVLLVLYSNLRSSAEVDPRALGADSGSSGHDARLVRGRRRHVRSDVAPLN